jgi:hypothetical protein
VSVDKRRQATLLSWLVPVVTISRLSPPLWSALLDIQHNQWADEPSWSNVDSDACKSSRAQTLEPHMKAIAAVLFCGLAIVANTAAAQYPVQQTPVFTQSAPAYSTYAAPVQSYPAPLYGAYSAPTYQAPGFAPARPGLLGRLMELERRKNAWLRRTFLDR